MFQSIGKTVRGIFDWVSSPAFDRYVDITENVLYEHLQTIGLDVAIVPKESPDDWPPASILDEFRVLSSFSMKVNGFHFDIIQLNFIETIELVCYQYYRLDFLFIDSSINIWNMKPYLKSKQLATLEKNLEESRVSINWKNHLIRMLGPTINYKSNLEKRMDREKRIMYVHIKNYKLPYMETIRYYDEKSLAIRKFLEFEPSFWEKPLWTFWEEPARCETCNTPQPFPMSAMQPGGYLPYGVLIPRDTHAHPPQYMFVCYPCRKRSRA